MALIVDKPVRSGQQVYAPNDDVVVLARVQSGAEVMAGGCIHIYGPCFGRLVAGAGGKNEARIFCMHFEPELVAIGQNKWATAEEVPSEAWGRSVQVWRQEGRLIVADLKTHRRLYSALRKMTGIAQSTPESISVQSGSIP